jgi:hypothetical protein
MLGVIFLTGGIFSALFFKRLKHKGIRCSGKIASYQTDEQGNKVPIVEFTTTNGETIKKKPSGFVSTNSSRFQQLIDKNVEVLYNPDNPTKFIIENEEGILYTAMKIFICIGILLIGLGICVFLGYIHPR